jgi:hypothetical protein
MGITFVEAGEYSQPSSTDDSLPYHITGVDARSVVFHIVLGIDEHPTSRDDTSEIVQILSQELDGDLRFMNAKSQLYIGNVHLLSAPYEGDLEPFQLGQLRAIEITGSNGRYIIITVDQTKLYEYPTEGKQTLISNLLDTKTTMEVVAHLQNLISEDDNLTAETCDMLKMELEKEYLSAAVEPDPTPAPIPAWILPTAICGGAVVLAGAATATAVVIRRKKRKAAACDNGAAPTEEKNA